MIDFEYTVVRTSRKKTIGFLVFPDGRVTVSAPRHVPDEQIRRIVEKKSTWIRTRLASYRKRSEDAPSAAFGNGTELPLLGRRYVLEIAEGLTQAVNLQGNSIRVSISLRLEKEAHAERIAAQLMHWYQARALEVVRDRVQFYQERLGVQAATVRVKALKSRWGSCSSRGNLSFCWQLVKAPLEVVDYVVVHELCHLLCMDHSPRFWACVESIIPDFRRHRDWLRRNGADLAFQPA